MRTAAFALMMCVVSAQAQVSLSLQAPPVAPGEATTLTLTVNQAAGLAGADLVISGPDSFLPGSAETTPETSDFLIASRSQPGRIQISMARAQGLATQRTAFVQVPFRIPKTAPIGAFSLTVSPARFYNAQLATITGSVVPSTVNVISPPPDLDADGLPDAWELQHFGSTAAAAAADHDNDGASDLAELLAGTDPISADSVFRVVVSKYWPDSDQPVAAIQWPGVEGKVYQIEWSDGPFGPSMVWRPVYNPVIYKQGSLLSWTDDGSRTLQAPDAVRERYYRIAILTQPR